MERQEQLQKLQTRILQAEEDRLHGAKSMSIAETREAQKKAPPSINADDMTVDELRTELLAGYNNMKMGMSMIIQPFLIDSRIANQGKMTEWKIFPVRKSLID